MERQILNALARIETLLTMIYNSVRDEGTAPLPLKRRQPINNDSEDDYRGADHD